MCPILKCLVVKLYEVDDVAFAVRTIMQICNLKLVRVGGGVDMTN